MTESSGSVDADFRTPGRPRITGISSHQRQPLSDGWECAAVAPDAATTPNDDALRALEWRPASVPGTVASALRAAGALDLEHATHLDDDDWWFRSNFAAEVAPSGVAQILCLDGLATFAEVWLNGTRVLSTANMFIEHEVDVTSLLRAENELAIRFRSLTRALKAPRPRPRWRTRGVDHQQLRWVRTTLVGHMSGWSPPVRAVGPWRAVRLERRAVVDVVGGDITAIAQARGGRVEAALVLRPLGGHELRSAMLRVGTAETRLAVSTESNGEYVLRGMLPMPDAEHWWPHTHGAQPRYDARILLDTSDEPIEIALPPLAFRRVEVTRPSGGFAVAVNDAPIFCRGACWTSADVTTLDGTAESYRQLLELARDAGMNMLRVGGTMVYEADAFYDLCDEFGILVWQDFMFANMDYPHADAAFDAAVQHEVEAVLARVRRHPSLAVLCGNSEVEQQAAMLGMGPEHWINPLFHERLPALCGVLAPGVPYWPGSPSGGALPLHADVGVSHYYGVGAYLRPLDDARRAVVRFASECLGFAHVPDQVAIDALLPDGESPFHHPQWKTRVPRDVGMGWDHEDVRDHYLGTLFGVDPMRLRYADMERYLALSRVVTGEVMDRTLREWRRGGSACRGALTWFFQDLWLGASFGVIDATHRPKPAYYFVKRAMQPVSVAITDEGTNGLYLQLVNDREHELVGEVTFELLRGARTVVASATAPVRVAANSTTVLLADAMLGRFHDTAYAYRFGPPLHDVAVATLRGEDGRTLGEAFEFSTGWPSGRSDDASLTAVAWPTDDGICIRLSASRFCTWIALECGPYIPADNYFNMMPGSERTILARSRRAGHAFVGYAQPLNLTEGVRIALLDEEPGVS